MVQWSGTAHSLFVVFVPARNREPSFAPPYSSCTLFICRLPFRIFFPRTWFVDLSKLSLRMPGIPPPPLPRLPQKRACERVSGIVPSTPPRACWPRVKGKESFQDPIRRRILSFDQYSCWKPSGVPLSRFQGERTIGDHIGVSVPHLSPDDLTTNPTSRGKIVQSTGECEGECGRSHLVTKTRPCG